MPLSRRQLITSGLQLAAASALKLETPFGFAQTPSPAGLWPTQQANDWYARQPWLVGANYIPSDAINQFEMFQAATWNPALNDRELALAQSIGCNTVRVFLHDQLWQQDSAGFVRRLNEFLSIAARHHIRPIFVLLDSCWDPHPHPGPQHAPVPGVHNSGWVQSPGAAGLTDPAYEPRLAAYVTGVVGAFAKDDRVLAWDIWNEPDNSNHASYGYQEPKNKAALVDRLLPRAFAWTRAANPTQPLTSGVWNGDWSSLGKPSATTLIQLTHSDILTFHNYGFPEQFEARIRELQPLGRPILCTEYMARDAGSLFDTTLPIAKAYRVAAIHWGLVNGKTQTHLPWDSWQHPYTKPPLVWHHDVFYPDGRPYRQREADLLRQLTGRGAA